MARTWPLPASTESRQSVLRLLIIDADGRLEGFAPRLERLELLELLRACEVATALDLVHRESPDLVLLALSQTPSESLELLAQLRHTSRIGIVTLGATNEVAEGVWALEAGADDHLATPFDDVDLFARLRAVFRRTAPPAGPLLVATRQGRLTIDLARHEVSLDDQRVHLTSTELRLLELLVTNPGVLLTHRTILERIWGEQYGTESNYLRVYVARLRKRLRDPAERPELIETATGIGYRWIASSTPMPPRMATFSQDVPTATSLAAVARR